MNYNMKNEIYEKLENDEKKFVNFLIIKTSIILVIISLISYFLFSSKDFVTVFFITLVSAAVYPFLIIQYYKGKKTLKKLGNIS